MTTSNLFPDSYEISKRMFEIWMQNVQKHSGEGQKDNMEIPVYATDSKATYRVVGVAYDPNRGIMLKLL